VTQVREYFVFEYGHAKNMWSFAQLPRMASGSPLAWRIADKELKKIWQPVAQRR